MIKILFILSIIAIPFSDFLPLLPLGEIAHELSTYMFLLTLLTAATLSARSIDKAGAHRYLMPQAYLLPQIMTFIFFVILISFIMNFSTMVGSFFRGRFALNKFLTSTMIVFYGFGIAYLTYFLSRKHSLHDLIVRPTAISVIICSIIAFIEVLSWQGGVTENFYSLLSVFIHAGSNASHHQGYVMGSVFGWGHTEGRARSVSYEPPALANYAGFAWPWIYAGFHSSQGRQKCGYFILWALVFGLIIAADSRTGNILLVGGLFVLILLRYVYLPPKLQVMRLNKIFNLIFWSGAIVATFFLFQNSDEIAAVVSSGDSISNISRYASMTAAFRMFGASPIWGVGFGQYGFHVIDYMPSWGYFSWEIRSWFTDPATVWPPVFSIYARLAAELGVLGLIMWIGLWLGLATYICRVTLSYQKMSGILLLRSYPLVISCFCVLLSGIPYDSLRTPMIWITLGLSCSYIQLVKSLLATQTKTGLTVSYAVPSINTTNQPA